MSKLFIKATRRATDQASSVEFSINGSSLLIIHGVARIDELVQALTEIKDHLTQSPMVRDLDIDAP